MAVPTFLGLMGFYRRQRGPRGCPQGRGGSHPWVALGPRQGAAPSLWVAPQVALLAPVIICPVKNRRKFSSNSENISRSDFLKYKNSENRELALGILSIG